MLREDLISFGLYISYLIAAGIIPLLVLKWLNTPFELTRKTLHMVTTFSIFPLLGLFRAWYVAVLAAVALALLVYPVLALIERTALYKRLAVERQGGEFKRSLLIVQLSFAILIAVFWGVLGADWRYVAVVAVLAWGFGDAAAALVGKTFGRRRIEHPRVDGPKTVEGTAAMFVVAGLVIFFTLLLYAGQPWHVSAAAALLVAPVGAAVELFSRGGMDTITVPLAMAFLLTPLMSLVARLGL